MAAARTWTLLWVSLLTAAAAPAWSTQGVPEHELKAAFVFNFAEFTDWPRDAFRDPAAPLVVCVAQQSPLKRPMESLAGRPVKGRPLQVRTHAAGGEVAGCHVLLVDVSERSRAGGPREVPRQRGMLTIGDSVETAREGLVVGLGVDNSRLVFSVNLEAARNAQLEISSKLLRLARSVEAR